MKLRTKYLAFLIAILPPLAVVITWHALNTAYPRVDAGDYYLTAQEIYLSFKDEGFLSGLRTAYLERGWRPIFFPVMTFPILALNQGEILASVAWSMGLIFLGVLCYSFLLLREFLPPIRAGVGTAFVCSSPWLIDYANKFMSELPLILAGIAVLFHLKRSEFLRSKTHSICFALWLALGVAIRPVEMSTSFAILLSYYLYLSFKKGTIKRHDLLLTTPLLLLYPSISFLLAGEKILLGAFGGATLLYLLIIWILRTRLKLTSPYIHAFSLFFGLICIWWTPRIPELFKWVTVSTGEMAKDAFVYGQMNPLQATIELTAALGGYQMALSVLLGSTALLFTWKQAKTRDSIKLLLIGLSIALPPIILVSLTPDIDFRRGYLGFTILNLFAIIFALFPRYRFQHSRLAVISVILLLQLVLLQGRNLRENPLSLRQFRWYGKQAYDKPHLGGDPAELIYQKLKTLPPQKRRVAILSVRGIDTSTFNILSSRDGSDFYFNYPQLFGSLESGLKELREYDFVLVELKEEISNPPENQPGYMRLSVELRKRISRSSLKQIGLRLTERFPVQKNEVALLEVVNVKWAE